MKGKVYHNNSSISGSGVFAAIHITRQERIEYFAGDPELKNTVYSLFLDGKHIDPTGTLKHLNHSCDPNSQLEGRWLIAKRTIAKDQEITINYLDTEKEISYHFICHCGTANCKGDI